MRAVFRGIGALVLVLALTQAGCTRGSAELSAEEIRRHNEAVGLMGQYRNEEARRIFAELAAAHPELPTLASNEAIALLNRQQEGDEEAALALAERILARHPDHLPARYVAGLAHLYLGRVEKALPYLLEVASADPQDAHAAYFAAQALAQVGRTDEALALYRRAIEVDPYLASAYYAAAMALRAQGRTDEARELLQDYQRLKGNPRAHLAEFRYTRMGPKASVQALGKGADERMPPVPEGPVLGEAEFVGSGAAGRVDSLLATDLDGDGLPEVLQLGQGGAGWWLARGGKRHWQDLDAGSGGPWRAAAFGDLDNDGTLDLVLCGRDGLGHWQVGPARALAPRTDRMPAEAGQPCHDLQLFDADHDGDLDLYRVGGSAAPGELLNNNLDGSWRALSGRETLLRGPAGGTIQALVLDADADRDLDLVLLGADRGLEVLRNDRLWAYTQAPLAASWQRGWSAATAVDPEASGRPTLVLADREGRLWAGRIEAEPEPLRIAAALPPALGLASLDADGDGAEEILVRHQEGLALLDRDGEGTWQLRWQQPGRFDAMVAVAEDFERGPSLLFHGTIGARTGLWRAGPGPGRGRFLALALTGRSRESEAMRSNASGIGTQIRLRRGTHWSLVDLLDRNSSPGQSLQPVLIGLGMVERADFVELQWSDGVMQTELGPVHGRLHRIEEVQRQLASCPVLFVWDGAQFRFVSDVLGVGGIGFLLAPGQYAQPRPRESFRLPDGLAVPREGRYRIKIAEPMEEAAYIDRVRLHVHDLPPGWSMTVDERMHTGGGPEPTGQPLFHRERDAVPVLAAIDQSGTDPLARLAAADFDALDPGPRDPRFLGRLSEEQRLELHLAKPLEPGRRYALIGHGWVEYPYSQTLFAAWQAGAGYPSYSLDLGDGKGAWTTLWSSFGYPAGMPREFALPLPAEAAGAHALRLRGQLEVYLDALRVVELAPAPPGWVHRVLEPAAARVERIGFPRRSTRAGKRPEYDLGNRQPFWDTRYPEGFYTDFGPAGPLLQEVDDGFVVIGPGDALDLAFAAPPPPPPNYTRVLVLEVHGYAKDMDLYTRDGGSLGPMPRTPGIDAATRARGEALNRAHNRRFQVGR